jgi:hypothetical protein
LRGRQTVAGATGDDDIAVGTHGNCSDRPLRDEKRAARCAGEGRGRGGEDQHDGDQQAENE